MDYWEAEELSWCPSWSNNLWQGWSCGLVHCPCRNATDPIWRVLASFDGISCWAPLKHSNRNRNPLANQLWSIDFPTPTTLLIIIHRLPGFLESLIPLKDRFSIHARCSKSSPHVSVAFFPSLKQNFIAYRSSKVSSCPDCILKIQQLWQSGFSRVYSTSCCSCSFEAEILKIGQSSHKMYSNNVVNFQECTSILNVCTKNSGNLLKSPCNYKMLIRILHFLNRIHSILMENWNPKELVWCYLNKRNLEPTYHQEFPEVVRLRVVLFKNCSSVSQFKLDKNPRTHKKQTHT